MATMEDEYRHQQNGRTTGTCIGKTLDLSSKNLTSFAISRTDLEACTNLVLNYNDISELPLDVGELLRSLCILSLTGNQLEELPDSLGELENLKELSVSENSLMSLPDSLGSLFNLTVLKLVGNKLKKLPKEFGALRSLKRLELDENLLTALPESFGLLKSLEILEAGDNSLETLPSTFGSLRHLEILNLSNNHLASLPISFGSLPLLQWVDLSSNKLTNLGEHFDSCPCLEKLYLTGNRLSNLPDWIGDLPKLQEISLRDNQLKHKPLPESFGQSSRDFLTYLDMSGNFITILPTTLGLLTRLDFLHLGSVIGILERKNFQNGNWIEKLPDNFGSLTLLRELRAEENQLSSLPENFGDLVSLEFLDLGQNMLRKLPASFSKLKSLRVCMLSKNNIKCLPDEFGSLDGLLDLRLDSNSLTELPTSFTSLTNLETLDLFDNQLTVLPPVLKYLDKLKRLDLDENNFDMPAITVPNLTKPNRYPTGKSVASKNWRTKIRPAEVIVSHQATKVDDSDIHVDIDPNQQSTHTTWKNRVLVQALRQGASMWQSHEGASTRESSSGSPPTDESYSRRLYRRTCSYSDEDDLADIDDDDEDLHVMSSPDIQGSDSTLINPAGEMADEPEEDWDTELEDVSCYDHDNIYKHPLNGLHKPFGLDPCFAFTPSNNHVFNLPSTTINADAEEGQFDDAD